MSHPEAAALAATLRTQAAAVRNAAHGLTEEEARLAPARSDLSIGGILKHLVVSWTSWQRREAQNRGDRGWELTDEDFADFYGSFALTDAETLEGILETYDDATRRLVEAVEASDPDAEELAPPQPWFGQHEPTPITKRVHLLAIVEEFARHAGHADIIREQLDGAKAAELALAVMGLPGNDFVKPWQRSA